MKGALSTEREAHLRTVEIHGLGSCHVVPGDWPYPRRAQDKHPDHVVYVCETHAVWWHQKPQEDPT
jgi:hypothetical protein